MSARANHTFAPQSHADWSSISESDARETLLRAAWQCDLPSCATLKFRTMDDVKQHQEEHLRHLSEKWTKLSGCPWPGCQTYKSRRTWKTRSDFRKHLKVHLKSHWCTYPGCNYGKPFARASDLDRHRLGHQQELEHPCPIESCSSSFRRKDKLREHTRKEHENFLCPFDHCGKMVLDQEREDHVRNLHSEKIECAFTGCQGTTSQFNKNSAISHLRTHHGFDSLCAFDNIYTLIQAPFAKSEALIMRPLHRLGRRVAHKPCKSCSKKKLDTNVIPQNLSLNNST